MIHRIFLYLVVDRSAVELITGPHEARCVRVAHRILSWLHHGQHIALGRKIGHRETAEQIHSLHREVLSSLQLLRKSEILRRRELMGETPHHRGDRMDGAASHRTA